MPEENTEGTPSEKTVIDIAVERMRQKTESLEAQLDAMKTQLEKVTNERNQATSFLEKNERGIAIEDLKKMGCTYSVEEFDKMSLDELDQLKSHYKYFSPPITFKSGADVSGKRKSVYDTLDTIYEPLEPRKKKLQEI